jgi:ankyrin repeat protein
LIRKALKNLPKTLDDTYTRLFLEIDEAYRQEAKNALCWLIFAGRPLQLAELAEAIIINPQLDPPFDPEERFPDPQNVLEILSSLITVSAHKDLLSPDLEFSEFEAPEVVATTSTVRLAHFSVKEYLISDRIKGTQAQYFAISDPITHSILAKCCLYYVLHYCNSRSKTRTRKDMYSFPLLEYASKGWYFHIHFLPFEREIELTPDVLKLLLSESALSCWLDVHVPGSPANSKHPFEGDEVYVTTPLCYASAIGLFHVVQELLALGHDPNKESFLPPLHRAVSGHFDNVVGILLEAGAVVNMKDDYNTLTPLHIAAEKGTVSIAAKLIKYGGDVDAVDEAGKTPLYFAAYHGNEPVARLLVESGASIDNPKTTSGQTPFHFAAYNEDASLSKYLLEHGANINAQNLSGQTALHYAAGLNQNILHLLLAYGVELEIETKRGETPLYWAATGHNYEQPIRLLINAGANIVQPLLLLAKDGSHEGFHHLFYAGILHPQTNSLTWSTLRECALLGYDLCTECHHMLVEHAKHDRYVKLGLTIRASDSMRELSHGYTVLNEE